MTVIAIASFFGPSGALVSPSPTELNYASDYEADLVSRGVARYARQPSFPGQEIPVMASPSGPGIEFVIAGGAFVLQISAGDIAFIGDSRTRYGRRDWWKNAAATSIVPADFLGCGYGIQADSSGTIEYSAANKARRWTAPGDSAGPWTPVIAGRQRLESATAGRWIDVIHLVGGDGLPSQDETSAVAVSGSMYQITNYQGPTTHVMGRLNLLPTVHYFGAGGAKCEHLRYLAAWYDDEAPGAGYDVFRVGTNSISSGSTAAAMIAAASSHLERRREMGRRIVVCGENARWGTVVGTPMTAGQLAVLREYNAWLKSWCEGYSESTRFVDLYNISVDPAYADGRPLPDILTDIVHDDYADDAPADGVVGAILFADAIFAALNSLGLRVFPPRRLADPAVRSSVAWMVGTTGTISTGASGTLPAGWTGQRGAGTDIAATYALDVYDDRPGERIAAEISATTGTQRMDTKTASLSLVSLGVAVGDKIALEADCEFSKDVSGVTGVSMFLYFSGVTPLTRTQVDFMVLKGRLLQATSPAVDIPPGCTGIETYIQINTSGAASGTIRFGAKPI